MSGVIIHNDPHVVVLDDPRNVTQPAFLSAPQPGPVAQSPKPQAKPAKAPKAGEPANTGLLVKQLKARLKEVERGIRERQHLEEERGQINRLLAAAKLEKNNVRKMRVVG